MTAILLTISYDGSHYAGWQVQNNALTVQECMMKAGSNFMPEGFTVTTASRTDAGVHAIGQRALLKTDKGISPQKAMDAFNYYLPEDIKIWRAEAVSEDFHPRYHARKKLYVYKIWNAKTMLPLMAKDHALYSGVCDIEKMNYIAGKLVGRHDFNAFSSQKKSVTDTIREIYRCEVVEIKDNYIGRDCGGEYHIYIEGNGFLYNMVRIIAGCIVKWSAPNVSYEEIDRKIQEAFDTGNRESAAQTMSAQGLTLLEITY